MNKKKQPSTTLKTVRKKPLKYVPLLSLIPLFWANQAWSQIELEDENPEALQLEEVIVTGSRIPRVDQEANSPLQVIDGSEFEVTTRLEVDELLNHVPAISVPNGATTNSEGNGRAAVALRNLGSSRTLVLINGRRVVGSSTSGAVDINSISPALIERVDVVTGGASAVYGSDAMAGVVNFITKRDFEGFTVNTQYGITEESDGQRYGADLTFGANSANGRGNIIVNAGYLNRDRILAGDRPFSAFALDESDSASTCARNASGPGAALGLSTTAPCFRIGGSSRIPGTLFRLRGNPQDLGGNRIRSTDPSGTAISSGRLTFNEDGSARAYQSSDVFNFNPFVNLLLPLERSTLSAVGHYELTDNLEFFAEGMYTDSSLEWRQAPFAVDVEDIPGGSDRDVQTSINNPFIDPATREFLSAWDDGGVGAGPDGIIGTADDVSTGTRDRVAGDNVIVARQFRRRPLEAGPREHINERETYRFVTGLKGKWGDNINWDIYYNYGKHERFERNTNRFSETRFRQAVLLNAAGDACADTSNGCVPVNFFGPNTMTDEQLAFLTYEANSRTDITQQQAGFSLGGSTNGFAAGPLGYSVGLEWRSEEADFNPDRNSRELEAVQPIKGSFTVKEAFGELNLPLLADRPGFDYLGLEAGIRVSDYDNAAGTVTSYKFGGEWRPVPSLKFRSLYQRATRAPNINELFRAINGSAEEATDMCQGTPGSQRQLIPAIDAFCNAEGVPSGYVQDQNQINIRVGGNPNLESETSDTWTAGFIWTPESMDGLSVTMDYYNIEIDGGISQFGGGLTGTFAACSANPVSGNPFCDVLVRNSDGDIDSFFTVLGNANASVISTSGVDLDLSYSFDLPARYGDSLTLRTNGTYVIDNLFAASTFATPNDCAGLVSTRGLCGEGVPQFQAVTDLSHELGKLSTRLRYRYVGSVGSELVAFDAANGIARADAFTEVGAEHYFDLFFGYQLTENLKASFSIRNLFDNDPPLIGDAGGEPNIDSQLHDPLGRRFNIAIRADF